MSVRWRGESGGDERGVEGIRVYGKGMAFVLLLFGIAVIILFV